MCGISGLFGEGDFINIERLHSMNQFMEHRGPNELSYFVSPPLAFGFSRLAIVDIEGGRQPLKNENQSICSVFNGEIYNYRQLREELIQKGHRFTQKSDAEIIPHLYEEFGINFTSKLRGTFAIALWDQTISRLMLVRDRLGVKPLYYRLTREGLAFASEVRALLIREVRPTINVGALDQYLSYRFVPAPFTIFNGIYKLLPGTTLLARLDNGKVQIKNETYWKLPERNLDLPFKEAVEKVRETLSESMLTRWPTEVPAGYFFSGGLDSSALVAMHQALLRETPRTYAIGFEKPQTTHDFRYYSELSQAREAARYFKTNHLERVIPLQEVKDSLPTIVCGMDEPIADPTAIPLYFLSQFAAANGEKVVFSGEGADELFGGYTTYFEPANYRRFNKLPQFVKNLMAHIFPDETKRFSRPLCDRYLGVGGLWRFDQKSQLYALKMLHLSNKEQLYPARSYLEDERYSEEERMLRFDLCSWLPEDALMKSDKMTMLHSLEIRLPYLDHQLVELVHRLPFTYKIHRKINKWILRKAMSSYLPRSIITRPKNGFPVPITAWLTRELMADIQSVLLDPGLSIGAFILPNKIEEIVKTEIDHRTARLIWALYTLEMYLKLAIPKRESSSSPISLSGK
ncbi:MAG: asparagine synthase (glutamine-hydrolyzing) [Bacillota bacterium]|nr:asparagine synthase (glutamine-hydrolyzing) [Bacillota bacterium]